MQERDVLKGFGYILILSVVIAVVLNVILLSFDLAQFSPKYREAAEALYSVPALELILYSGIAMPILEEVVFRSILFRMLRKRISFWGATITSAILFGVYHGNLVQFIYATLCGAFFAYVYEKGQSVFFSVWAHIIMNLTASIFTLTGALAWLLKNSVCSVMIILLCTIFGILSLRKLQKMDVTKLLNIY